MSTRSFALSGGFIRHTLAGLALALPLMAALPARAEVIPVSEMARGIDMTPPQCAAQPLAVWVVVARRGYCIRYYMSTAGGDGDVPVVWLSGDKLGRFNSRTGQFEIGADERDVDTEMLQRQAENLSKQAGTRVIYLARPGLDGSSGFHGHRRSWLELYVLNAALDAIKQRYGYAGFHLAGQSGGAGLVGGLLVLRDDIGCAVPGAGRLALLQKPRSTSPQLLDHFDAVREIRIIAGRRNTRIIVVTDPNDKRVQVQHQTTFVQQLRAAGGQVEHLLVKATDELNHGVTVYTRLVVASCVHGKSTQEILAELTVLQQRRLAVHREREQRQAGVPQAAPPARAPAPAPAPAYPAQPRPAAPGRIAGPGAPMHLAPAAPRPMITPPSPARAVPTPVRPMITPPPARTASGGAPSQIRMAYF